MFGWDWLMNHEFSHEWFANQLSVANYDDLWLHEGLGSYAQPLLAEYLGGEIDYMAQLKSSAPASATSSRSSPDASDRRRKSTRTRPGRAATSIPRAAGSRTRCAS